uniref:Mitochondrial YB8B n=1 Tax=Starmerella bombicola TaxID=75736 RepID=A0A6M8YEC9_STABO|nr:mitochondrial YB8B [Starmerella bombicola]
MTSDRSANPARVLFCSYVAATGTLLVTFPLDTIKTRLQTSQDSFASSISGLYHEGGIKAFYRGVSASLISASAARAMNMGIYAACIPTFANLFGINMSTPNDRPALPVLFSGITAGAFSCILTGPFEFTKTASQVESLILRDRSNNGGAASMATYGGNGTRKISALQAVRNVRRRGGWSTLYGGVEYHCLRDSVGSGIYFTVYESLKKLLSQNRSASDPPRPIAVAVSGGVCGAASWLAVYPIDTMKSEYQRDLYSKTLLPTSLEYNDTVVRRPKFRFTLRMYRGLGFSLLRTSFSGICLFGTFEYLMWVTS